MAKVSLIMASNMVDIRKVVRKYGEVELGLSTLGSLDDQLGVYSELAPHGMIYDLSRCRGLTMFHDGSNLHLAAKPVMSSWLLICLTAYHRDTHRRNSKPIQS